MSAEISTFIADLMYLHVSLLGYRGDGIDLFKSLKAIIPDGPGPFVSMIQTVGRGNDGTHNAGAAVAYERPSCQLTYRALSYDVAYTAACTAYTQLRFVNQFINGTWWVSSTPGLEPSELPADAKERVRIVFNLESQKRVSPASS